MLYSSCTINIYIIIIILYILMLEEMNKDLSFILLFSCALFILLFVILSVTYHLVKVLSYLSFFYSITTSSPRRLRPWLDPGLEVQECSLSWPQSMVLLQLRGR